MVLWMVGAAVVAVMSVSCGVTCGARVSKGEESAWSLNVLPWAVFLHGGLGVLALFMVMQAVR